MLVRTCLALWLRELHLCKLASWLQPGYQVSANTPGSLDNKLLKVCWGLDAASEELLVGEGGAACMPHLFPSESFSKTS